MKMKTITKSELVAEQQRAMTVQAESVNPDGSFEAVLATEAPVTRYDWNREERYEEVLEISQSSIDSTRLDKTIPLLDQHGRWGSVNSVLGRIDAWWIEDRKLIVSGRIDIGDPAGAELHRKIEGGFIKDLSVGYQIMEATRERTEDQKIILRATKWMPNEGSFVIIPADPDSDVRSSEDETAKPAEHRVHPCNITTRASEESMKKTQPQGDPAPAPEPEGTGDRIAPTPAPAPEPSPVPEVRAADPVYVMERCEQSNLDMDFAKGLMKQGFTRAQVNDAILDRLAEAQPEPVSSASMPDADNEERRMREGVTQALEYRLLPNSTEVDDRGRHLIGMPMSEIARATLGRSGTGLHPTQIFDRALHTSSDFALALADVANKTLRREYEAQEETWSAIARQTTVPDFKSIRRLQTGQFPDLELVNEHGEFKAGTFSESQESYQIYTYGKIVGLSRQALINDDLESLPRVIRGSAQAVSRLRGDTVWGLVTANGAMADGDAFFHANHSNLGTTGVISDTTLTEARKDMRLQTGVDGKRIKVMGKTLVVPPSLETTAEKYMTTILAQQTGNVNIFSKKFGIVVEERLEDDSTTAWYIFADPGQIDIIEAATLNGQNGPDMQTRVGFEIDGIEWRIRDDFGAGKIDWRGAYKNAGA